METAPRGRMADWSDYFFRGDPAGVAVYKGNAVVNIKISLPPAAGGAVVVLSTKPCQLEVVWKTHQSIWKNVEIRPKTNDMPDGKPASAQIWSIFRPENNYFWAITRGVVTTCPFLGHRNSMALQGGRPQGLFCSAQNSDIF